jgi:hypothetical protein
MPLWRVPIQEILCIETTAIFEKKVLENENIETKFHAMFNNDRFLKKNENLFNATSTIYKHCIKKLYALACLLKSSQIFCSVCIH